MPINHVLISCFYISTLYSVLIHSVYATHWTSGKYYDTHWTKSFLHVSVRYSTVSMVRPNRNSRLQSFETSNKSQNTSKTVISLRKRTWILERMCLHASFCTPAHVILKEKFCTQWNVFLSGTYSTELVLFPPKFTVVDVDGHTQDLILWATFWTTHPTPLVHDTIYSFDNDDDNNVNVEAYSVTEGTFCVLWNG